MWLLLIQTFNTHTHTHPTFILPLIVPEEVPDVSRAQGFQGSLRQLARFCWLVSRDHGVGRSRKPLTHPFPS